MCYYFSANLFFRSVVVMSNAFSTSASLVNKTSISIFNLDISLSWICRLWPFYLISCSISRFLTLTKAYNFSIYCWRHDTKLWWFCFNNSTYDSWTFWSFDLRLSNYTSPYLSISISFCFNISFYDLNRLLLSSRFCFNFCCLINRDSISWFLAPSESLSLIF